MEEKIDKGLESGLINFINVQMDIKSIDVNTLSPLVLAFIGDGVYDLVIRTMVVEKGNARVKNLHKQCSDLVKAPAQAKLYNKIKDQLTEEEANIFRRGRNTKTKPSQKRQ